MRKLRVCLTVAFCSGLMLLLNSCEVVKPYQKTFLNEEEMKLSARKVETFEFNFQTYREGAAGANSGKVGGGCGCN
ncbi:DUF4266 domain-containing protein [Pontibacter ruber]|uniref:DUF4266 domain-containing protein n=1 Tax=Pontibacter ruber TaxID=1343895 RepID=A0ABW5CZE5_9BACT|nr:DUF4266 domain-containing protein [Pontibacter ruber]